MGRKAKPASERTGRSVVAVNVSDAMLDAIDSEALRAGKNRSAVVRDLLEAEFGTQEETQNGQD